MCNEVVKRYDYLVAVSKMLTANEEDARDLVQDTVVRAIEHHDQLSKYNLSGWLYSIMKNIFIDGLRRPTVQVLENSEGCDYAEEMAYVDEYQDVSIDFAENFSRLKDKEQKALMFYAQGFQYNEIDGLIGESMGNVKKIIHNGRQKLKRIYE